MMEPRITQLTQKMVSRPLTNRKWNEISNLVFLYNVERHSHIHTLQKAYGVVSSRDYRDALIKEKVEHHVPARAWKQALDEAYQLVGRHWAGFGAKMKEWVNNRKWSDGELMYAMWLCSIPECMARMSRNEEIEAPIPSIKWLNGRTIWTNVERLYVEYVMGRYIRKHQPKYPKPVLHRSMVLDSGMWNLRKTKGGSCLRVSGLESGNRISIPLMGYTELKGNLRLVLCDGYVEIHDSYEVKPLVSTGEPMGLDLGQTEAFVDDLDGHWGEWMQSFLKECDEHKKYIELRLNTWRQVHKLEKLGHIKKAQRIIKNNLGTTTLNLETKRINAKFMTLSRRDLRAFLNFYQPSKVCTETLDNFKTGGRKRNYISNSEWRHASTHEGLEILGARSGTAISYTPAPYASCTCPECGFPAKDSRNDDKFECVVCEHVDDADRVGAVSALNRGADSQFPKRKEEILNYLMEQWKSRNRLGNLGFTPKGVGTKGTASVMTNPNPTTGKGKLERKNRQSRGNSSGKPKLSPKETPTVKQLEKDRNAQF